MEKQKKCVDSILEDFQQVTKKPDSFLNADEILTKNIKSNLKEIYDHSKSEETKVNISAALPELIIKNFDLEQIWQQLELQNESLLSRSITNVSRLVVGKDQLIFDNLKKELENFDLEKRNEDETVESDEEVVEKDVNESSHSSSESDNEELQLDDDDDEEVSEEDDVETNNAKPSKKKSLVDDDDDNEELQLDDVDDEEVSEEDNVETKNAKPSKRKSVVDDEFFKLDEMEKFLNNEDKKIDNENVKKDFEDSDSESEVSVDLFEAASGDEDDEDEKIKTVKFKDFFVAKDNEKKAKRNKFLEGMSDDEVSDGGGEIKSSLELRQERLKKKIQQIEENAISEKPWQLKGEIRAEDRPQNSLLEEIVDFELTSRPAPIITEKTTLQLDDIIRQRIKDRAYDSVERKAKPVETPLEYKKKLVLDQEKSRQSLAQIYEKEFLDQQAALNPLNAETEEEDPQLHKEVRNMMKSLFNKLDALSNFHFTPKPSVPELKIVNNLPAITMEEVAPNATSDAALLAPEEVKNKSKGELMEKSERTDTDKNRERRKKKLKQRAHLNEKKKRESTIDKLKPGLGNKYSKEKAKKMLQKVIKEGNTEQMDEQLGSKAVKSSKAFFTQLQEEVHLQIHGKIQNKKSKKKKDDVVAKKIKL